MVIKMSKVLREMVDVKDMIVDLPSGRYNILIYTDNTTEKCKWIEKSHFDALLNFYQDYKPQQCICPPDEFRQMPYLEGTKCKKCGGYLAQPQKQTFTDDDFLSEEKCPCGQEWTNHDNRKCGIWHKGAGLKKPQQIITNSLCDTCQGVCKSDIQHPTTQCQEYKPVCDCKPQQEFCECSGIRIHNRSDTHCLRCGKSLIPETELMSEREIEKIIIAYHNPENLRWIESLAHALVGKVRKPKPEIEEEG